MDNEPTDTADATAALLSISHIPTPPAEVRHSMSLMPSPLKSPVPAMAQTLTGSAPKASADLTVPSLFISQTAIPPPPVSRQRMSDTPSPLKSPVPAICQTVGNEPTPTTDLTVAPFMNHSPTPPA